MAAGLELMPGPPSQQLPHKYLLSTLCVPCTDSHDLWSLPPRHLVFFGETHTHTHTHTYTHTHTER